MVGRVASSIDWWSCPPPLPFWIPAFAGMTRGVARVYAGSESRTCFHSNRSCRLLQAHQGLKMGGWLADILYGGSGLGEGTGLPEAGDKPQRYISPTPPLNSDPVSGFGA